MNKQPTGIFRSHSNGHRYFYFVNGKIRSFLTSEKGLLSNVASLFGHLNQGLVAVVLSAVVISLTVGTANADGTGTGANNFDPMGKYGASTPEMKPVGAPVNSIIIAPPITNAPPVINAPVIPSVMNQLNVGSMLVNPPAASNYVETMNMPSVGSNLLMLPEGSATPEETAVNLEGIVEAKGGFEQTPDGVIVLGDIASNPVIHPGELPDLIPGEDKGVPQIPGVNDGKLGDRNGILGNNDGIFGGIVGNNDGIFGGILGNNDGIFGGILGNNDGIFGGILGNNDGIFGGILGNNDGIFGGILGNNDGIFGGILGNNDGIFGGIGGGLLGGILGHDDGLLGGLPAGAGGGLDLEGPLRGASLTPEQVRGAFDGHEAWGTGDDDGDSMSAHGHGHRRSNLYGEDAAFGHTTPMDGVVGHNDSGVDPDRSWTGNYPQINYDEYSNGDAYTHVGYRDGSWTEYQQDDDGEVHAIGHYDAQHGILYTYDRQNRLTVEQVGRPQPADQGGGQGTQGQGQPGSNPGPVAEGERRGTGAPGDDNNGEDVNGRGGATYDEPGTSRGPRVPGGGLALAGSGDNTAPLYEGEGTGGGSGHGIGVGLAGAPSDASAAGDGASSAPLYEGEGTVSGGRVNIDAIRGGGSATAPLYGHDGLPTPGQGG